MNVRTIDIQEQYSVALSNFIIGRGEEALQRAYEIGRDVIADGGGCLDLLRLHEESLLILLADAKNADESTRIAQAASKFLAESLSPFEMTHRGFQEAIEELKRRAEDLTSMNERLGIEIGEREEAEENLRKSEETYRTLVHTARDVIYTLSTDGLITSLNPAFEGLTGWKCSEWVGKHFAPIVHPDDIPRAVSKIKDALDGKNPAVIELRVMTKSGDFIVGEFISTPQFQYGRVVGVLGIARDVTERKRTEKLLRDSEEQFRLITENIADLIVVLDTEGRRLYNSPSYASLLGNTRTTRGTDSFFNVHPDDRDRIKKVFRKTVETGIGQRAEYRFVQNDGVIRYIESQGSVIRDAEGKTEKVIVVSRDITERKLADVRLKESEKQLADAQQMAHIGSWEWDVALNRIRWSDELYQIYGITPEGFDLHHEVYLERLNLADRENVRKAIQASLENHQPFRFEHRIFLNDGIVRVVEAHGEVILDEKGSVVKMVGTSQDITERKKADEAVRELAKRVVAAQEDERRRVARELHDNICQRLSAVKMDMEVLEEEANNKRTRLFKQLQRLKKELGLTIKEVRDISANLRPTILDDLGLANALQLLCREFERKQNIKVDFEPKGVENSGINIDKRTALYRIAQEAFMNIAKYAHAKKVSLKLCMNETAVMMTIQDNGKGFEPEGQRYRKENTGNGLTNMRERSQLLGGIFRITSARNKGTTIYLEIPLEPK